MILALGLVVAAAGFAMSVVFLIVGLVIFAVGLIAWIGDLLPGRGHMHEPVAAPEFQPKPIVPSQGAVERLKSGMPGYRMRLPEHVHPISAGVKGGIMGGIIMPIPALLYGIIVGRGIWYPVNLLAGIAIPGVESMSAAELDTFHPGLFATAVCVHIAMALIFGMIYGVLLPTLPEIPRPAAWGALLMPLLWTAISYNVMGIVNPALQKGVDWPWFIVSQFLFGVFASLVVQWAERVPGPIAGLLGGLVGGLFMPIPAILWSLSVGRGIWYPANLLAGLWISGMDKFPLRELEEFHPEWLLPAIGIHAILCLSFGLLLGLLARRLPRIPGPIAWGGLLMPSLWMASCYGLMSVVNPALQAKVDWPWFIVSQFIFGVTAAVVVLRSEMIYIPPAGQGEVSVAEFVTGKEG
jgi:hypothetical protein